MRCIGRLALVLVCGSIASVFATSMAAEDKEDGFVSIFNGRNLDGWIYGRRGNGENKSGKGYQVENGVLYCTKEDGGNLFTEKQYSDFVLRFEFKLEPNSNNGLGIRAPLEGDAAYVGMELQILDNDGPAYKGKLQPTQYHGSIYDVVPAKLGALKPAGEWNKQEVIAKGRQITVKLNGTVIVDANLDDIKDEAVLKKHPGLARTQGHIGFLGHGTRVEIRNIRIKELGKN